MTIDELIAELQEIRKTIPNLQLTVMTIEYMEGLSIYGVTTSGAASNPNEKVLAFMAEGPVE